MMISARFEEIRLDSGGLFSYSGRVAVSSALVDLAAVLPARNPEPNLQ